MIATAEENRGTLFAYFLSDCICKLWLPQDKLSPPSQDLKQLMCCHGSLDRLLCPVETNYYEKYVLTYKVIGWAHTLSVGLYTLQFSERSRTLWFECLIFSL